MLVQGYPSVARPGLSYEFAKVVLPVMPAVASLNSAAMASVRCVLKSPALKKDPSATVWR